MKNIKAIILGGLTIFGAAVAGVRTYQARKAAKEINEANIIEIEVESKQDSQK